MKPIQYSCQYCGASPITRVHKDGNIFCSDCNEPLLKDVDNYSLDRYIVCPNPKCRFDENFKPQHGDKCQRCGALLL